MKFILISAIFLATSCSFISAGQGCDPRSEGFSHEDVVMLKGGEPYFVGFRTISDPELGLLDMMVVGQMQAGKTTLLFADRSCQGVPDRVKVSHNGNLMEIVWKGQEVIKMEFNGKPVLDRKEAVAMREHYQGIYVQLMSILKIKDKRAEHIAKRSDGR